MYTYTYTYIYIYIYVNIYTYTHTYSYTYKYTYTYTYTSTYTYTYSYTYIHKSEALEVHRHPDWVGTDRVESGRILNQQVVLSTICVWLQFGGRKQTISNRILFQQCSANLSSPASRRGRDKPFASIRFGSVIFGK